MFYKHRPAFGLDLSDFSLKIVQLKKRNNKLSLDNFIQEKIPAGVIQGGEIKQEKELVTILRKSLRKAKGGPFQSKRVVCNLPEEKVFIRIIQLPLMKKDEIDKAVKWEAESHIPLSIDEVYLDWHVIKPVFNHLNHLDVLVAAVPRPLVDSYLSFLKKSELEPIALEPESVAMTRALMAPKDLTPTIIVDLGGNGTNFVIFSALAIRFTSHIQISGQLFTQAIIDQLKVDEKKANQMKFSIGLNKSKKQGEVYKAMEPIADDLAEQISDYIDFYHDHATHIHGPNGAISQVLLCGGGSLLPYLPFFLSQKLNLPVRLGNPLTNILSIKKKRQSVVSKRLKLPVNLSRQLNLPTAVVKQLSLPKDETIAYTTALGLALKEFSP